MDVGYEVVAWNNDSSPAGTRPKNTDAGMGKLTYPHEAGSRYRLAG